MADMADNLVTLIDTKWSGPAKPDIIEKVIERPDWGKFGNKDIVTVFPLGSGRHIHVTRDYYNVIYGFEIFCHTPTSSDRLKELYEEVIDILYNWYLTGVDKQRVVDQKDVSDKKTGKFKYTIHIELEAIMVYKGAPVTSGIPAGEGTYTATALKAESDEEIDIMDNSANIRALLDDMDNESTFCLRPYTNNRGYIGNASYIWKRIYGESHHCTNLVGPSGNAINIFDVSLNERFYFSVLNDDTIFGIRPLTTETGYLGYNSGAWKYVYAFNFVDKTPYFDKETAIQIVKSLKSKDGKLDHAALHEAIKVEDDELDKEGKPTGKKAYGRNMGALVSALTEVVKDLLERIAVLEAKT